MTKREIFTNEISDAIKDGKITFSEDAAAYFEAFKVTPEKEKKAFTENGKIVLQFMKDNMESYNNLFKAKDIGEGLEISSRTASGAMRKLITDNYVIKIGESPVIYALTEKGISAEIPQD